MDIELERKAFEAWHESEYGEHVTWANGAPVSHIHDDRWQGWRAAVSQTVSEENTLLSATLDAVQKLGSGDFILVPREPTEAMIKAGYQHCEPNGILPYSFYKAMIEAQEQSHDGK